MSGATLFYLLFYKFNPVYIWNSVLFFVNSLINPTAQLNISETLPMVVLDGNIISVDEKKLAEMIANNDFSPERISELLYDTASKEAWRKYRKRPEQLDTKSKRRLLGRK